MRFHFRGPPKREDGTPIPPIVFVGGKADEERWSRGELAEENADDADNNADERYPSSVWLPRQPGPSLFERITGDDRKPPRT